jgi:pimeloyl-ACP methyl ester carboxylesterase
MRTVNIERSLHELPDGRLLDVAVSADRPPEALVVIPGAPNGPILYEAGITLARSQGLTYLSYARPGYAGSTRQPDRTIASFADDLAWVAGTFGLRRLYLFGWSMGGPHALAGAALLPELVGAAASVGGLAPHREDGVDWRDEIGADGVRERLLATPEYAAQLQNAQAKLPRTPDELRAQVAEAPEADRQVATDHVLQFMVDTFQDGIRSGIWGWHDDVVAAIRPWGFDVSSIRVPVTIWQGTADAITPPTHGAWLGANVPGARLEMLEGEGHLSGAVGSFDRIVERLLEGRGGA